MNQVEKAKRFAELHVAGTPLLLYNAWDAGSAKAILEAGAKAIATSSWSVAAAQGYGDGEAIPISFAEQIVGLVALILQLGQACCVDRSRVAQDLGQQRSVEIASLRFDVHLDAGQREGFLGDDVCDVPGYVLRDSDEIEA